MFSRLIRLPVLVAALALVLASAAEAGTRLRVVTWNVYHGQDINKTPAVSRQADFLASLDPDVVALQEVERFTGYGNADHAAVFKQALEQATGVTWYAHFSNHSGKAWGTGQQGNLILSRFPLVRTDQKAMPYSRAMTVATAYVNGRKMVFINVHLTAYAENANRRVTQMAEVSYWLTVYGTHDRFVLGDFNASDTATELDAMRYWYRNQWTEADKAGRSIGSPATRPSGSRIDHVFFGKYTRSWLALQSAEVVPTSLSDHYPVIVEYVVD